GQPDSPRPAVFAEPANLPGRSIVAGKRTWMLPLARHGTCALPRRVCVESPTWICCVIHAGSGGSCAGDGLTIRPPSPVRSGSFPMKWRMLLPLLLVPILARPGAAGIFGKKSTPNPADRVPELINTLKADGDENKRMAVAEELRQYDPSAFPQIV